MGQDMAKGRRTEIEFLNGLSCVMANRLAFKRSPLTARSTSSKGRSRDGDTRAGGGLTLEGTFVFAPNRTSRPGAETAALAADHDFISHRIPAV